MGEDSFNNSLRNRIKELKEKEEHREFINEATSKNNVGSSPDTQEQPATPNLKPNRTNYELGRGMLE